MHHPGITSLSPLRAPTPWHYFSLWTSARTCEAAGACARCAPFAAWLTQVCDRYDFGVSAKDPITGQYDLSAASRLLLLWATVLQQICLPQAAQSFAEGKGVLAVAQVR